MNIIEEASRRLAALQRSGIATQIPIGEMLTRPQDGPHADVRFHAANRPTTRMRSVPPRRGVAEPRRSVTLDYERLQASGHLVSMQTRSLLAEQFRCVKRPLLKNRLARQPDRNDPSLIMVTSALPGEGKTFCAINLAFSIAAEIDLSVLLVDADVVHPQMMTRLGADHCAGPGLLELLADAELDIADFELKTNLPNLTLLPAGAPQGLSTELLSSQAMKQLLSDLSAARSGRIVIFDGPPLLLTNEAVVLASHVGQVLVVVEASSTPAAAIQQAFELLKPVPVVMSVLNKGRTPSAPIGKGYYYYVQGSA